MTPIVNPFPWPLQIAGGGGIDTLGHTTVTFKPGVASTGNQLATWAEVKTFVESGSNPVRVFFDDSVVSPCVVDQSIDLTVGSGAMYWQALPVLPDYNVQVSISDGVEVIGGVFASDGDFGTLEVTFNGTTKPFRTFSPGELALGYFSSTLIVCAGTQPFIEVQNGVAQTFLIIANGGAFKTGTVPVANILHTGGANIVRLDKEGTLDPNTLECPVGAAIMVIVTDTFLQTLDLTQPAVLGSLIGSYATRAAYLGFDNAASGLSAETVQEAIDELVGIRIQSSAGNAVLAGNERYVEKTSITPGGDTVTLPATPSAKYIITIIDTSGSAGTDNITIDTAGAELINGAATAVINGDYDSLTLYSNGTDYFVI